MMRKTIEIQGIVTPYRWDVDNNIVQISLNAEDETVYLIKTDKIGKEIERYIQSRVKIIGTLLSNKGGFQTIKVDKFIILPWLSFTD